MLRHSTAIAAILADTSETLPSTHARAPHAAASTEEELSIAVSATETRQLCDVGSLRLSHTGALRKPFKRAPRITHVLRVVAANTIDRADARVSVIVGWRCE